MAESLGEEGARTGRTVRHVLVTGAAGGIGRAVAEAFAADGGTALTLVDIDEAGLAAAAEALDAGPGAELGAELDGRLVTALTAVDLTSPDGPAEAVDRAWESRGPVDVLVNAAGVYPSLDMIDVSGEAGPEATGGASPSPLASGPNHGPAEVAPPSGVELWDRVFALNTRAPALATAALARRAVAASRTASVVNISSGAALRARPGGGPYASSKAALEMATRAAALELGPHGIRVNAVSPGFVPVASDCNPVAPEYAAAVSANPLGRTGTPRDVARAVRWIAGEDAAWITGEILRVDGGSAAGAGHLPRLWPPAPDAPPGDGFGPGPAGRHGDGPGGRSGDASTGRCTTTQSDHRPEGSNA